MKKALITGITGQDGSYLAELLLEKGYEVHGLRRRSSVRNTMNIEHLQIDPHINKKRLFLHYGDMTDSSNLNQVIAGIQPDEIYNLAAQSHVHTSFQVPEYTAEVNSVGTLRLIDTVKNIVPAAKFYQASTSELYGKVLQTPQNENTPFNPRSPYAISKLYSFWILKNYREAYNLFCCNGILFNHESPRRNTSFVTHKITEAVANIEKGAWEKLYIGNLDAKRDWGYAKDYVEAMWLMLQQEEPEDYVIASGENHSVREFVEKAFAVVGRTISWQGSGIDEIGYDKKTGDSLVKIDPYYFRPTEVDELIGDPTKARQELGWKHKVGFNELVELMVKSDLNRVKQ